MKVIKRDGREVDFSVDKIEVAVKAANKDMSKRDQISQEDVERVCLGVYRRCERLGRTVNIEEIQDMVVNMLDQIGRHTLARLYSEYRLRHELQRRQNSTDAKVLALLRHDSEVARQENANKDPVLNSTLRDYLASEVSEDICRRYILPEEIVKAHDEGIIHFHKLYCGLAA